MLDHREYMQAHEERAQQIIRDHERLRLWAYSRKPSLWRRTVAWFGNTLVNIGTQLQMPDQRQQLRKRITT